MNKPHAPHGVVEHASTRPTDYLYRMSLKCLVKNAEGKVLVVKESGRDWWDLPGGGMDHGEDFETAIARELNEEVSMTGKFSYRIIDTDEPHLLNHGFWQVRLVFEVTPENMTFTPGVDADELAFMDPEPFAKSTRETERRIARYYHMARG